MRRSAKQIKIDGYGNVWVYSIRWLAKYLGVNTHYLRRLQWGKFFPKPVLKTYNGSRWYLAQEIVGYCTLSQKFPWYKVKDTGPKCSRHQFKIAASDFRDRLVGLLERKEKLNILSIKLPDISEAELSTNVVGATQNLNRVYTKMVLQKKKTGKP